jgi:ferric-dicitrate binding protein FerR (iron transport regulator)
MEAAVTDPHAPWPAEPPPDDFADRVMDRIARERDEAATAAARRPRSRVLAARAVGALAVLAAVGLVAARRGSHRQAESDVVATVRTELALGRRGVAVLERGAHVSRGRDEVTQSAGDVFYRVEPAGPFRVHTPGGDVEVLGTCFRVRVEGNEGAEARMNTRDVRMGTVGAAIGAAVLVTVYEGKVALSRESGRLALGAGESARADSAGVRRTSDGADAAPAGAGDEPLLAANANLADSVRVYKNRLEALQSQKKAVEKQLAEAKEKLAIAQNDGQAPEERSEFDLSADDWKELAKSGEVRAQFPCLQEHKDDDFYAAKELSKAGLSPEDGPVIKAALDASRKRIWDVLRPLCVKALQGQAALADKLGPMACHAFVGTFAHQSGEDVGEELREVAEIRAGLRPMPSDVEGSVMKVWLTLTGESKAVEQDLARSFGPEQAHRIVYGGEVPGCWNVVQEGGGPQP